MSSTVREGYKKKKIYEFTPVSVSGYSVAKIKINFIHPGGKILERTAARTCCTDEHACAELTKCNVNVAQADQVHGAKQHILLDKCQPC